MTDFSVNINADIITILIIAAAVTGFTLFNYKYTIPQVSGFLKGTLVFLRSLVLFLILLIIFEPTLILTNKEEKINPLLIFIDNSASILKYGNEVGEFYNGLISYFNDNLLPYETYTFGSKLNHLSKETEVIFNFNELNTNFDEIFDTLKEKESSSFALIISDGNYNVGKNPLNMQNVTPVTIFTIGAGDTIPDYDLAVSSIIKNEHIYKGKPTTINAEIKSNGFEGKEVEVKLFEANSLLESKTIKLNESGINTVQFSYTPHSIGQKKLRVAVSSLPEEKSHKNNSSIFYVNVLKGKINTLLITSSPTPDFGFIYQSLKKNSDIEPNKLLDLPLKPFNSSEANILFDSADVIFLLNFPTRNSSEKLVKKISTLLNNKSIPLFFIPNLNGSKRFIEQHKTTLGFSVTNNAPSPVEVQPNISDRENPILNLASGNRDELWNNLPPVNYYSANFSFLPGAKSLLTSRINNRATNFPLLISYELNKRRSLTLWGKDFWRWKLSAHLNDLSPFDELMSNSVKWLNAVNIKRKIKVEPVKRVFASGEKIEFIAEVNNEAAIPVENANVIVKINDENGEQSEINLLSIGEGIYKGSLVSLAPGDYNFSPEIKLNGKIIHLKSSKFSVEEFSAENLITTRNIHLLTQLSENSGGKYFQIENRNEAIEQIAIKIKDSKKIVIKKSTFPLWHYEITLLLLIILLSLEWFIRKRAGLL